MLFPASVLTLFLMMDSASGAKRFKKQVQKTIADTYEYRSCSSLRGELANNLIHSSCTPREMLKDVDPDDLTHGIIPNKVPVKLCDGSCFGRWVCMPTKTETVTYAVRKYNFITGKQFCGVVQVEQHLQCQCGCPIMKHHCNALQEYRKHECRCVCKNLDEENQCHSEGKLWDPDTCTCGCYKKNPQCSTGTVWIPDRCKCVQIMAFSDVQYSDVQ